jgi:hypothetical protein
MSRSRMLQIVIAASLIVLALVASGEDHFPNPPGEQCPVHCWVQGWACDPSNAASVTNPCRGLKVCFGIPRDARKDEIGHDTLSSLVETLTCWEFLANEYPDDYWASASCDEIPMGYYPVGDCTVPVPGTTQSKCCYMMDEYPSPMPTEGTAFEVPWLGSCVGPSPKYVDCGPNEN